MGAEEDEEPVDVEALPTEREEDEVQSLRTRLARSEDRRLRALADLDNYRKRMEREGDRRAVEARDEMLLEWLDVRDSVERALGMEPGDAGLTAVREQIDAILARHDLAPLAEVGEIFDPARHEAIASRVTEEAPDRSILDVARAGFGTPDGVLRSAQVVVARRPDVG